MKAHAWFAALVSTLVTPGLVLADQPTALPTPAPVMTTAQLKKASVADLVTQFPKCKALASCGAVQELVRRGDAIWPALQVGLEHKGEMTRFWTLGVLSEKPIKAAQAAIGAMLDDKQIRVRAAAAYALGAQKDKKVTPFLLKALKDKDLNVRFAAAVAFARVKDPAAIPALIAACRDRDEDVRAYAALALGDIGDRKATKPIIERLEQDLNAMVRGFAAMALSKLRDPASFGPLAKALKQEDDPKALAAAIHAIAELGDTRAIALIEAALARVKAHKSKALRESKEVAEYAKDALTKLTAPPKPKKAGAPAVQ